ncbi:MAG: hypothetical protein ACON42_05465 [Flavobacteriaceae bacterium]
MRNNIRNYITIGILFLGSFCFAGTDMSSNSAVALQLEDVHVVYKYKQLILQGCPEQGKLEIFSIIGNPIYSCDLAQLKGSTVPFELENNNMYIVRISIGQKSKTFKIIA